MKRLIAANVTSKAVQRLRRPLAYVVGFGFLDAAAFQIGMGWGYAAVGVSLIALEMLTDGDEK